MTTEEHVVEPPGRRPYTPRSYYIRSTEVIEFINSFCADHGYSPSYEEIGEALGLRKASVSSVLTRMVQEGLVSLVPHQARTVRITGAAMRTLEDSL